jgi:truncated hemoglobin YjbI
MSTRTDARSPYEQMGGMDAVHRLVEAFYTRVERDPLLRPLFPGSLRCAREHLACFLAEFCGGPPEEALHYRHGLREAHARFRIGEAEASAWLANMTGALEEAQIPEPSRSALHRFFEESARFLINHPRPPAGAEPEPAAGGGLHTAVAADVAQRWAELRAVDELLALAASGDHDRTLALVQTPLVQRYAARGRMSVMRLLGTLACTDSAPLLEYAREYLERDPGLATAAYTGGATLLHAAAGAWATPFAELLLRRGAEPDAVDRGGHTPLYCAGNRFPRPGSPHAGQGRQIVELLVRAGADVNAARGVKRCTALHMAARRGGVSVAEALLDHGADIEARDSLGETPLRRAVNCSQPAMVSLLLARGADARSRCRRGKTPLDAARGAVIRSMLGAHEA